MYSHEAFRSAEFLKKIARGDAQALGSFYEKHAASLYAIAFCIVENRQAAENVIVDTFTFIWKSTDTFDSKVASPFDWALGITRKNALIQISVGRQNGSIAKSKGIVSGMFDADRDVLERRNEILDDLPSSQRRPIELAQFAGLNLSEIEEVLQVPRQILKNEIRLGMLKLRDNLKQRNDKNRTLVQAEVDLCNCDMCSDVEFT